MKDIISKYNDVPIKAFLGNDKYANAKSHKAESFTAAEKQQAIDYLQGQFGQLNEVIKKVFDSFDKDKSGYIDVNELADVAKELGRPMDHAELEECMKDLDINKDNKISLDEFSKWWLSGRQGLSKWMRRLLSFKLKTTKFVDAIGGTLKDVVSDESSHDPEVSTNSLSININKVMNAGTTLNFKALVLTPEVDEEYNRIKQLHKFKI